MREGLSDEEIGGMRVAAVAFVLAVALMACGILWLAQEAGTAMAKRDIMVEAERD